VQLNLLALQKGSYGITQLLEQNNLKFMMELVGFQQAALVKEQMNQMLH
jgi:hypothetical protein